VVQVHCALCRTTQPLAEACVACGTSFGRYTCLCVCRCPCCPHITTRTIAEPCAAPSCRECRYFDDDIRKEQFHCAKCGICRVGGRANFFHCDTCGCCISTSIRGRHRCVERSLHSNCPVCQLFLFDSIRPVTVMRCGHSIHEHCFQEMFQHHQFTCPLCSRSTTDMTAFWRRMDEEVEATPMPPEYAAVRVDILCNDCGQRGSAPMHVLGMKCAAPGCGSYNTRQF
jgi:RING finger/CHY zinc finger protein 1